MALRALVRHVMEKALWNGSAEVRTRENDEREVKKRFLTGLVGPAEVGVNGRSIDGEEVQLDSEKDAPEKLAETVPVEGLGGFWDHDEGVQEIQRITKEA